MDTGCGPGYPTQILQNYCSSIIGIDIADASQNISFQFDKSNISETLSFLSGDATCLPFKNNCFDTVVSFDVIEHIENDLVYLKEIRRVMKNDAKLLLETPNVNRLSNKIREVFHPIEYPLLLGDGCIHVREYSHEALLKLLVSAGFRNINIKGPWLGLPGRFEFGLHKFPKFFEKYAQYWFVEAFA